MRRRDFGPVTGDAPLSKASIRRNPKLPRERRNPDGSRTIFFEEYVQDFNGSVAFAATSYPVQPGVATLFAWLSTQAISYQEYAVESLAFRTESDREATAPGKVMIAFQQDPTDPLPAGKQEMLENEFKAKCKTWENNRLVVPERALMASTLGKRRFIRSGNLAANLDLKTYDIGQLIVATQGQADATDVGELYVEYGITLMTPVINSEAQALATSAVVTAAGTVSAAAPLGSAPTVVGGLLIVPLTATITFNRVGKYLLVQQVTGTGLSTSYVPAITGTAAEVTAFGISNAAANTGTSAIWVAEITVSARGQTFIATQSGIATTITATVTEVAQFTPA
jgi:hypothetical protein